MALPTRPLGSTGMDVTRVGFGAWAAGGGGWAFAWGDQDDDDSVRAIRRAVESGVNWVDTAAVYGLGHSEEVVARALKGLPERDRPFVFTKCGLRWDNDHPNEPARREAAPSSLRQELESSLRRLDVERIDLYQVHWPAEDGTPIEDYWGELVKMREEGKIRAAGLSNHGVEQLARAEAVGHVDSFQPPFSAIKRSSAREVAWCAANGTGVIAYSPMQAGLLTGSFTEERAAALGPGDWRSRNPEFRQPQLGRNLALAGALRPVARRLGTTVPAVAIAWVLAWPGVTGAIVGGRSADQVDGWLPAAALDLSGADLDEIAEAIRVTGAGDGPERP
ncbi:MAG TPA: aldo/keto reductase [Acidimicrobiales bacterium]|nr:aldo/keto reductase [Acidimicrobiales bacterium]